MKRTHEIRKETVMDGSMARSFTTKINIGLILVVAFFCYLLFPSASQAASFCGGGDGIPLTYSPAAPLTMDGDMADWGTTSQTGTVLNDGDNNVTDGPYMGLIDRDAPVQSTGRDIIQFSFTYDDTWLYFYTERTGSASNTQTFIYYSDIDNDGFMEDNEPAVGIKWKGNNRTVDVYTMRYNAVDSVNGDAMVDTAGFGDGYTIPGNFQNISGPVSSLSGIYGSADGMAMEFAIPWDFLTGIGVGPVGHSIHVSATNANLTKTDIASQIDDNLGGCGGGAGSLQYADLDFSGAFTFSGYWGDTVWEFHHLVNLGNGDDSFAFAYTIFGTWSPTVSLFVDNGDSIFTTGDSLIASTVGLASGGSVDVISVYDIGNFTSGIATVVITATSQYDPIATDSVTDTIEVLIPDLLTIKSVSGVADARAFNNFNPKAIPGASVTYSILVTNFGNGSTVTDSVVITDTVPAGTEMYVGDGSTSPVLWAGAGSGLTFNFVSLADTGDDIDFTSDSGPPITYNYTPTGADGYDSAVTGFQVNPKGAMNPDSSSFTFSLRVRVR